MPSLVARILLWLRPLGDRRSDVEADLMEAYDARLATHGRRDASRRLRADVVSLWTHGLLSTARAARPPRWRPFNGVTADLSYAARLLRRHPVLIAMAMCGLGAGIGASTAVFSVLNAAFLRPLGVADPTRTLAVGRAIATPVSSGVSTGWPYATYLQLRSAATTATLEAFDGDVARFGEDGGDETAVNVTFVSGTLLGTLGARTIEGRLLTTADDRPGAPPAAVVSYGFWLHALGGDRAAVGRRVRLNGATFTIVGIAARDFTGPMTSDTPSAFWLSLAAHRQAVGGTDFTPDSAADVRIVAHLARGASLAQAQRELSAIAARLPAVPGSTDAAGERTTGVELDPAGRGLTGAVASEIWTVVMFVTIIIALVLLLSCANVTNLLLASAAARRGEIAVRLAMGASGARIVRQLLTESLLLAAGGGLIGWIGTQWTLPLFASASRMPAAMDIAPDTRVYTFLAGVSLLTATVAGLATARHAARGDLISPLRGRPARAGRRSRAQAWLIGLQAAASLMLLVMASLFDRAAVRITHVDVGVDVEHLVSVRPVLGGNAVDDPGTMQYWRGVTSRILTVPGVASASLAEYAPFGGAYGVTTGSWNGQSYRVTTNATDERYFSTVGIRVLAGRIYDASEVAAGAHVVVISQSLARVLFADVNPLGGTFDRTNTGPRRIIGVVSDAITADLARANTNAMYVPLTGRNLGVACLVIRTTNAPDQELRGIAQAVDAPHPAGRSHPVLVREGANEELVRPRVVAVVASSLGAIALALALMGLFGVTTFVVGQRMREVGVRLAVGATTTDIIGLLVRDAMRPVVIGLGVGLVFALAGTRVVAAALYGVSTRDPVAIGSAMLALIASAVLAVLVPARRGARIDPARILRDH